MRSTLKFHQAAVDENLKVVLVNDFLQLSKILESLKASDPRAFHAMYGLLEANIDLEEQVAERGSRIAKLQRGQTQPK
jgi:pyruvate carboxylase